MFVEIGGIPQWVEIAGDNPDNPMLLILHGGPGASTRFASGGWRSWQEHFTLVYWDQRGAGRTYLENGPDKCMPMSLEQIVSDGLELAEFLRDHLGQRQMFLLGHSWGSAVGIHMVKRRPDLFRAFVGTGQLVNFGEKERLNHANLLAWARERGDAEALAKLTAMSEPPYAPQDFGTMRMLGDRLVGGSGDAVQPRPPVRPDLTPEDREAMGQGFLFSCSTLMDALWAVDLPALGLSFDVPIFIFMGSHDQHTPAELAKAYLDGITAPAKAFVRFEGCHHFVHINRPDDFLRELVVHLLPELDVEKGNVSASDIAR